MQQQLLTHAIRNVWCSPDQDKQLILNLKRMNRVGGVRGRFTLHWVSHRLPTELDRYHIYPIGQNSLRRFNLPDKKLVWLNLQDLANERNLLSDIYTTTGHSFNRSKAWFMITGNNNIILAVQDQDVTTEISSGSLYLRMHTNAYFASERSAHLDVDIRVEGIRIEYNNEQLALQGRYHQDRNREGHAMLFHNGTLVDDVLPNEVSIGDFIESVYDASILEVVEFRVKDLKTYRSSLDENRKYLVHLPKSTRRIDYRDDVDFYLFVKDAQGRKRGRYLHQNRPNTLRMVTHRDYGIATDAIDYYIANIEGWTTENVGLLALVRESGYERPLIDEHHRIKELYRLDDVGIVNAMLGINSIMPEWKAAELESSSYTRIMRARYDTITAPEVVNAYGYNAMAKWAVQGLLPVAQNNIALPAGLVSYSTILEYDNAGLLLGHYHHYTGDTYTTRNAGCRYIEGYPGLGGTGPVIKRSSGVERINPNYGYRFYTAVHNNGVRKSEWTDVTDDTTKYRLANRSVEWLIDPDALMGAYNCTDTFFLKEYTLSDATEFIFEFDFSVDAAWTDADGVDLGQILVFLNGHSLVEDLDYIRIGGHISICNVNYLKAGAQQQVLVMALDRTAEHIDDRGFVIRDRLSVNSTYDVRDDKVVRCVVDGKVKLLSDLPLDEHRSAVVTTNIPNGKPYSIRAVPVPLHGVAPFQGYPLQDRSQAVDRRVSEFLTQQLPEPEYDTPPSIIEKYVVFSPVLAKILSDLTFDLVATPDLARGEDAVEEFMVRYEYLLPFDPCRHEPDLRYVAIAPHRNPTRITVTPTQFRLLEAIARLYLRNNVDISHGVTIEE